MWTCLDWQPLATCHGEGKVNECIDYVICYKKNGKIVFSEIQRSQDMQLFCSFACRICSAFS